jgi:hypothetical protein
MDKENEEGAKKPQIGREIKLLASACSEMFESLFEVLELSQDQIDRFQALCDEKMHNRREDEYQVSKLFLQLIAQEEGDLNPIASDHV